ncbi:MAG: RtcB family protein [Pirellulaceae bacterium]
MNKKKLLQLGVPADCVGAAIHCIQKAADEKSKDKPKRILPSLLESPQTFLSDPIWGKLAEAVVAEQNTRPAEPIGYLSWGTDLDDNALKQMENACKLPISIAAALMPDAHVGYGLPIGGVLACDNAVIPYGVGVDIACRVKLTITDLPVPPLEENSASVCRDLDRALAKGTVFGTGGRYRDPQTHAVMDQDWTVTAVTREMRDRAWQQLGTSGSGNHFVEWGVVTISDPSLDIEPGTYVGLLSHSGSRGAGARVCQRYTDIARQSAPSSIRNDPQLRHLAWLDMDSEAGQEYWAAMNLMGQYAAANHEIIHRNVLRLAGAKSAYSIENHHNFAWKETHAGRDVYVHRKGATPASKGDLGIIPGNMADSCFLVRGKGNLQSLNSASHGAGRVMSRTAAKKKFRWKEWTDHLREQNVRLLAGGIDEVPGVYKDIREVMAAQSDLVDVLGSFTPRIVMMCGDGSPAED